MSGLNHGYIEKREVNLLERAAFSVLSQQCPGLKDLDWARLTFELDSYMLGYARFASDHTKEAITSWTRSLELRPDPAVQQYLSKAQREQNVESEFSQGESSHFTLHYEGRQTSETLRSQILQALEADYDDLVRDLGNPPRDNILVTLYTEQAFFDVTHAPTWSGAMWA